MEFFSKVTTIDFLGARRAAAVFSSVIIACAIALLVMRGLNFGIDFTGGTLVEIEYAAPVELDNVRKQLQDSEFRGGIVQYYGTAQDVMIRLPPREDLNSADISEKVIQLLDSADNKVEMRRVEFVGSQVGDELAEDGGLAMIYALIGILTETDIHRSLRQLPLSPADIVTQDG